MSLLTRLSHPLILVSHGFLVGAALFFSNPAGIDLGAEAPRQGSILTTVAQVS